jgi:transcriptional regulator with XRE-family HTH domain
MNTNAELRDFLRTRRARLQPEDVGLPTFGERRRVPGLRREDVAQLAGVSFDYYVRLEQGRTRNVSESVLDAVANALQLSPTERTHLFDLARPTLPPPRAEAQARIRSGLRRLVDTITETPAFVVNRHHELVAWNALAGALLVEFEPSAPRDRNLARFLFLDERARTFYRDWDAAARDAVATLRMSAGRDPNDPVLNELIGELSVKSAVFRRRWADHDVKEKTHGTKQYRHPVVGDITLSYEALRLPADPDLTLMIYTVEAGSPSEEALRRLAALVESRERHAARAGSSESALDEPSSSLAGPGADDPAGS